MPYTSYTNYEEQKVQKSEMHLFADAEEAWFWFIAAQEARNDGARFVAGAGLYRRPCEPIDILKVLDRLYRARKLERRHFMVLRHYGRRHMAPDPRRVKEKRAAVLWDEALTIMSPLLEEKGIIAAQPKPFHSWVDEVRVFKTSNSQNIIQGY